MWCLSLVLSECSLSGRGQGQVSNFCIVDLENFAIASRRYKGDIRTDPTEFVGVPGRKKVRAGPVGTV